MLVEWSYDEQFDEVQRLIGPHALETTDFTARQGLRGLESGRDVFVRVSFQGLDNDRALSEPVAGRFVVPPDGRDDDDRRWRHGDRDVRFLWSGDTAGQGWGINPAFGGMKISPSRISSGLIRPESNTDGERRHRSAENA